MGGLLLYNATGHATSLQRRVASFGKEERLIKKIFIALRDGISFFATGCVLSRRGTPRRYKGG